MNGSAEAPWFPDPRKRYLRVRVAYVDGRHCVLCRRVAHVFVDVKRGPVWWWDAFPICKRCAQELPGALIETGACDPHGQFGPSPDKRLGRRRRSEPEL